MVLNQVNRDPCEVYSLTWSEFGSSLTTVAQNLRSHDELTDVTISAGGKIYPAHKLVLSAASPLLMELLKNTKCQHPILMLAGVTSHDFEIILDFIYQGEIKIDSEKLPSVLQAAQLLDIRALSPSALVLNSDQESFSLSINGDKESSFSFSNEISCKNKTAFDKHNSEEFESRINLQKRKRSNQMVESSDSPSNINSCKRSSPLKKFNDPSISKFIAEIPQSVSLTKNINDVDRCEDEKKIISDLPVNCKLCGVTIRQSRNLRRHIDHMHPKPNFHLKSRDSVDKIIDEKSSLSEKVPSPRNDDSNNIPHSSGLLNFSEDSFTQLTEEIFSCTGAPTITSPVMQMSVTVSDPMNEIISTQAANMPVSSSLPSAKLKNSLSGAANGNLCLPLPTTLKPLKSSDVKNPSTGTFEGTNLDYTCNTNDITLKELESQLFSVCFCSAENDDV